MMNSGIDIHIKNMKVLKNYLDNPNAESKLKIQILQWMYDNLQRINSEDSKTRNTKFVGEVMTFIKLIESK